LTGDENDFGRLSNFGFSGGVKLLDNLEVEGTLRQSEVRGGRDNGFAGTIGPFAVPADDQSTLSSTLWLGRLAATLDTFDGRWSHQFRIGRAEITTTDHDATFLSDTKAIGINTKYGYSTTYRLDSPPGTPMRHFLTGLIEREEESFVQPVGGEGIERERGRTGLAGEIRGEYFNSLFLAATVRRDDNELFEDATTWRTAASLLVPSTPLRVHASYGTAVKYPSFSEQFGFFIGFLPNPNLTPEHSRGWDAGIETTMLGGRAVVDVTYFDQDLDDEIDFRAVPVFQFEPFNRAGTSRRRGVEVAARYLMVPGLTLGASYTYLDATEDSGRQEIRRPPHSGRIDLNYAFDQGRANLNVAAIYNGTMTDTAFEAGPPFGSQIVTLDDYWLVTAAASYRLRPGVEIYGRVENLLDQGFQEVFGYNSPGIAAYAGMRFTFEAQGARTGR
jgi:vitamin B12 transporter